MNAAITVCSTLTNHVKAAQKKMNTNYPIIELDNSKHSRPEKFWHLAFLCHGTTSGGSETPCFWDWEFVEGHGSDGLFQGGQLCQKLMIVLHF